ncbi:biotin--[acetyl-CoA-carboxylase] ligase [Psychroflexus maritimus]|uniref:Biotin--[acetyl-CoA-carboxylase] ligase n=1 Tax=Psychroflexus maritimus TaxID=2714865 RepID=A0A967E601_9FLAO|nr:biotin--[acetyl-CoA-carboxylase] ligase [Psychroflexus maritimus]NGZ89241.1 biotin--[acetyl-CoA-carboxylase] ligase [Psychroflexus maritimus]
MKVIRHKKCASTNDEIKRYFNQISTPTPVCLITDNQYGGKGQLGAKWSSLPNKNLTFSFLFPNINLSIEETFKINLLTILKLNEAFKSQDITNLLFKWPNDLILQNKKIGGILIENILQANLIKRSVIGIGINLNQTDFKSHPKASSLKRICQRPFDIDQFFRQIILHFEDFEEQLHAMSFNFLLQAYHQLLFRLGKTSMFELNESFLPGIIRKVNKNGRLVVEFEDRLIQDFDVKEIKLIY